MESATLPDLVLRIDGIAVTSFRPHLTHPHLARWLEFPEEALLAFDQPAPEILRDGQPHQVDLLVAGTGQALKWSRAVQYAPAWHALPRNLSSPGAPEITAIVLNRNGAPLLERLWQSFSRHNSLPLTWIVVDHASSDDSLRVIRRWQRRISLRCLALKENHSFSASCNRAAARAKTPFLLFLNNDIVWTEDALPELLSHLKNDTAAVGMKLVKTLPDAPAFREVQHLGIRFTLHEGKYRPYEAAPSLRHREQESDTQAVAGVTGAVLLCRREEFEAVGGFDTDYFYGFEDVDLCLRWHQQGKRCVCVNRVSALHAHGATRLTISSASWGERLMANGEHLDRRFGLWLKQIWWHDLLTGQGIFTSEPLTIAVLTRRRRPPPLARQLADRLPSHAEVRLANVDADLRDVHILVLTEPEQLGIQLVNPRADLQRIAYVAHDPLRWIVQPQWLDCFAYAAPADLAAEVARLGGVKVAATTAENPLGDLLEPRLLKRALIHFAPNDTQAKETAKALRRRLKQAGWACWFPPHAAIQRPLVDVEIAIPPLPASWQPGQDCLTVTLSPPQARRDGEQLSQLPDPDELTRRLEQALGHSCRSPQFSRTVPTPDPRAEKTGA